MNNKARTIITTDGEVDDMNSFLRYLLYSDCFDTEGIVLTSSVYHYAGDPAKGIEPYRWTGSEWIKDFIDLYAQVYPNLKIHAEDYPSPEYLKSIYYIGNIDSPGEMTKETKGSKFLEDYLINDTDPRKLYIQTWGGTNTTARALKSIEEKYAHQPNWSAIKERIEKKVIIYIILDQDVTYSEYIEKNWSIEVINDRFNFWYFAYAWKMVESQLATRLQPKWQLNLRDNHGPLLKKYALIGDGNVLEGELEEEQRGIDQYLEKNPDYARFDFISEGDSPSYFYFLNNGLRNSDDPSYGGWGGRFEKVAGARKYINSAMDYNPYNQRYEAQYTLTRWFDDIQDDFKGRAAWCVAKTYDEAAHYPVVSIKKGNDQQVTPGETVQIQAKASDPNQRDLAFKWWHYFEASTYQTTPVPTGNEFESMGLLFGKVSEKLAKQPVDPVKLVRENTETVEVKIPEDIQSGQTIHLILEVTNGTLTTYQRVILIAK